ncbi:hypothetical protein WMY93_006469 [Mugilogobius chulae]|uniref:Uncharacterized protein n=1 Tax=Mugilogobius chulae TaxID=88201 RepID=A0AAW0PNB5_9GOBI
MAVFVMMLFILLQAPSALTTTEISPSSAPNIENPTPERLGESASNANDITTAAQRVSENVQTTDATITNSPTPRQENYATTSNSAAVTISPTQEENDQKNTPSFELPTTTFITPSQNDANLTTRQDENENISTIIKSTERPNAILVPYARFQKGERDGTARLGAPRAGDALRALRDVRIGGGGTAGVSSIELDLTSVRGCFLIPDRLMCEPKTYCSTQLF